MTTKTTTSVKRPAFTWIYEYGVLTVQHHGVEIPLGRYATHEHAAKAAVAYFEKHGGRPAAT